MIMEEIERNVNGKVERIDGVKIWVDDSTWIFLRPSGTEPLIRVFAESDSMNKLNKLIREYSSMTKEIIKKIT